MSETESPKIFEQEPLILESVHSEDENKEVEKDTKKELRVSPSARKLASESKIDLQQIEGSGKNGLVLKRRRYEVLWGLNLNHPREKLRTGPKKE